MRKCSVPQQDAGATAAPLRTSRAHAALPKNVMYKPGVSRVQGHCWGSSSSAMCCTSSQAALPCRGAQQWLPDTLAQADWTLPSPQCKRRRCKHGCVMAPLLPAWWGRRCQRLFLL